MTMKKRSFPLLLVLGIVLVAVSLSLVAFSLIRGRIGANVCRTVVAKMQQLLPERQSGGVGLYENATMPVLQIDGVDYAALLEIPSMQVALPVANEWNPRRLSAAPARFCGSVYDRSLVIGGTDSSNQFAFCSKIEDGTQVTVTDMTGASFTYEVTAVDRAKKAEKAWLANESFDLTLYCRDTYSMEYVAVRCSFIFG